MVIDGVMYTSGNLGRVYALNAATGEELWTFEPEVDMQANRSACCDQANRGVQVARTARSSSARSTASSTRSTPRPARSRGRPTRSPTASAATPCTGAPEIAGDLVIIGNAGAEYDVRGYVTAYNVADGSEEWRFWTIPHDPSEGPQESEALEAALEDLGPRRAAGTSAAAARCGTRSSTIRSSTR